jgi:uncharacterized protein
MDTSRPAGAFGEWLDQTERVRRGEIDADVPCGSCTACCTSSQFIHIAPDEVDTLAHIPPALLFPAPRLPAGHVLMGYDERGHCPMLRDGGCSIYAHRPRTCRTYDCRVFPAAGVAPDDSQPLITERAAGWDFSHPTEFDRVHHDAVKTAAAYLAEHREELGGPSHPTQHAVLAVELHALFLTVDRPPALAAVKVELARRRSRAD